MKKNLFPTFTLISMRQNIYYTRHTTIIKKGIWCFIYIRLHCHIIDSNEWDLLVSPQRIPFFVNARNNWTKLFNTLSYSPPSRLQIGCLTILDQLTIRPLFIVVGGPCISHCIYSINMRQFGKYGGMVEKVCTKSRCNIPVSDSGWNMKNI